MSVIGGIDWVVVQKALYDWVKGGSGLDADKLIWSGQDAPRPKGPAITLHVSNLSETGGTWNDTEPNYITFADKVITSIDTVTDIIHLPGHGLNTGTGPCHLVATGSQPDTTTGPLFATTKIWIVKVDEDHIRIASSYRNTGGGQGAGNPSTSIDLTSTGTGTLKITATPTTVKAGEELNYIVRGYLRLTLELRCHSGVGAATGNAMAIAILQRVRSRAELPSQCRVLDDANIGFTEAERIRSIQGTRDSLLFEPRAYLDLHFCVPLEERETLTIIELVQIQNLLNGQAFSVDVSS